MQSSIFRTIVNRATGETVTFLETAQDTNGAHLLLEVSLPPNGDGPPLHMHDQFVESFECIEGKLTLLYGKKKTEMFLSPGETFTVPLNEAHTFMNRHEEALTFRVKLTPPLFFEESMRIHYGLMDDGLTNAQGQPKSLAHTALILSLQNTRIVGIPIGFQRWLFNLIVKRNIKKGNYQSLEKYIGKSISEIVTL